MSEEQTTSTLSKEEMEALSGLDLGSLEPGSEDFKNRIIKVFENPKLTEQFSDLSIEEIKLLSRRIAISNYTGDRIGTKFCETYIKLKISNNRKGRTELVDMVIADMKRKTGMWDKFKNALGIGGNEGKPP